MHLTILLPYLSNGRISITVDLGRLLSNGKISWTFRVHFHVIQLKKCSLIGFCQMFIAANKLLIANSIQDHSQTKIQQLQNRHRKLCTLWCHTWKGRHSRHHGDRRRRTGSSHRWFHFISMSRHTWPLSKSEEKEIFQTRYSKNFISFFM